MKISDKIVYYRKKEGWSQETLAFKLDVSRQAVSKWESGVSVPDLEKVIGMSELFGISTDTLLKDESNSLKNGVDEKTKASSVSDEEAKNSLKATNKGSIFISVATLLCILSPITLLLLGGLSASENSGISSPLATGVGLAVMLLMVAVAIVFFIPSGILLNKFEYLSHEKIIISKEMTQTLTDMKKQREKVYITLITVGIVLCVISILPLFIAAAFSPIEIVYIICVCAMMIVAGIGVALIIRANMVNSSIVRLLQVEDYSPDKKRKIKANETFSLAYWMVTVAIYLTWSFISDRWETTWIVWPIAALLFVAFNSIMPSISNKR